MHASQCELAAFNLVHDYPGGAQALGPMIGKLGTTLSHEVNPNQAGYKLGLRDMEKLSVLTGNPAVLNALAASMGYFPPIPMLALPPENTTLNDLMRQCASVAEKGAKVLVDFQMRASDMEISPNDAASVMAAIEETVQALTGFRLALQEHVAQKDRP